MPERFFIIGCQRTGTTLLRLILEAHPDVFCYDELKGYAVLQNAIVEAPFRALIGFKIPRWTEQFTNPVLLDDGPEGPCNHFYCGEKILFLHRDVRDTVASMLKLKAGESNWCEIWVPRIIDAKLANDTKFGVRYAAELDLIKHSGSRLVGLAALYWKYKTEAFFFYRNLGFPVLPVAYEGLVMRPLSSLQEVCIHLGISFNENLLRHNEFQHAELFPNGLTLGNTDPAKPIQVDSVGQWPQYLSEGELALIARIAGDLPARVAELFR